MSNVFSRMAGRFFAAAVLLISLVSISSCSKKQPDPILFDNEYPLALTPDVRWAVVTDPYVAFKKAPDWNSETTAHTRKGEILQVEKKTLSSEDGKEWYCFKEGWLPSSSISVFSNRYKAITAAASISS